MILKINGDIVGNDWKEIYDWFGIECSTPGDVQKALAVLTKGGPAAGEDQFRRRRSLCRTGNVYDAPRPEGR